MNLHHDQGNFRELATLAAAQYALQQVIINALGIEPTFHEISKILAELGE